MSEFISGSYATALTITSSSATIATTATVIASGAVGITGLNAAVYVPGSLTSTTIFNAGYIQNSSNGITPGTLDFGIILGAPGSFNNSGTITGNNGVDIQGSTSGAAIVNSGVIKGTAGLGITLAGVGSIANNGAIYGSGNLPGQQGDAIVLSRGGGITNAGLIQSSYGAGVYAGGTAVITQSAGAIVGQDGIILAAGGSINNHSQIQGTADSGVIANGAATISNYSNIYGVNAGISLNAGGVVFNDGVVKGLNGSGVALTGTASVYNANYIRGVTQDGIILHSNNENIFNSFTGKIIGYNVGIAAYAGDTVTNAGSVTGGTYAVSFASGSGNRLIDLGGNFGGIVSGGNSIGSSFGSVLELGSTGRYVALSGLGSQITNFSTIIVDSQASWNFTTGDSIATGQSVIVAGTLSDLQLLTNNGTIEVTSGTLNINGSITGQGDINLGSGASASFNQAVSAGETINLVGSPSHFSVNTTPGLFLGKIFGSAEQTLTTSFTDFISAETIIASGLAGSYLVNSGTGGASLQTISAAVFGPAALGTATVSNQGVIIANGTGTSPLDLGILLASPGTIINAGTIEGHSGIGILGTTGHSYIDNTGVLYGSLGVGIYLQNAALISNSGSIGGHSGIQLANGGTLVNNRAGHITGTGGDAIDANKTASISNAGTIIGANYGIYLSGGGTVSNSGLIQGASYAVKFASGFANRLIDNGGTFVGVVDGGNSIGSSIVSTLELAAPGGTLTSNSNFSNFGSFQVDAGASWTIANGATIANGQTVNDLGSLTIDGTLVNNGIILAPTGTLTVNANVYGTGGVFDVAAGTKLNFTGTVGSGETILLTSRSSTFTANTASFFGVVETGYVVTLVSQYTSFGSTVRIATSGSVGSYLVNSGGGSLTTQSISAAVFGPGTLSNPTLLNKGFFDANGPATLGGFDVGVFLGSTGTILNAGTVIGHTGIGMAGTIGSNYIYNSNLIYGSYGSGIYMHNAGNVVNSGIIFGKNTLSTHGGDTGIELVGGGTVINRINGTIASHHNYAIDSNGPLSVSNSGLITGYSGINSNGTAFISNASTGIINVYRTGIELNGGGTVLNAGAIQATGTQTTYTPFVGVYLTHGGTVLNSGSISGPVGVKILGTIGTPGYVENSQFISASSTASPNANVSNGFVNFGAGVYINVAGSVVNTGTIFGNHAGVAFNNANGGVGTLNNTGGQIISSAGYGVLLEDGGKINNTGLISGYRLGVRADNASATITNTGIILATGNTFSDNGTLSSKNLNPGTYVSHGIALNNGGSIFNQAGGTIAGAQGIAISGVGSGYVYNTGLINATNRSGIDLKDHGTIKNLGAILANHAGVQIYSGGYVENTGQITSLNRVGIYLYNNGYVTNSGTITANYAGIYSRNGSYAHTYIRNSGHIISTTKAGVYLKVSGQVGNSGIINGAAAGVFIATGKLTNNLPGTITGATGIYLKASNMTNQGVVDGTAGSGIYLKGLGNVFNSGSGRVIGSSYGVGLGASNSYLGNSGTVTGATGLGLRNGGSVVNSGTITGLTANGIYEATGSASITNKVGGKILGNTDGIRLTTSGNVTNLGLVRGSLDSGILLAGGGSVVNSGSITGVYQGIHLKTIAGYIKNTGLVESTGTIFSYVNGGITYASKLFGVQISNGGTLVNAAGGTIASGLTGVYTSGASTIVNAGTIFGTNADAVDMTGGGTLVVDPTATFIGTVTGGGTANLELSGTSTATLSGIGTQFINFATIKVDTGTAWTLSGNNTINAGQTLNDFGLLTVNGTFTDNGMVNADPSTIVFTGPVVGTGTIDIFAGSNVIFEGPVGSGITINFIDATGTLTEADPAGFAGTITGAAGTVIVACFVEGTRILTPRGEIAVEKLREGDLVITRAGEDKPIKWIGTRSIDLRRHVKPEAAQPIRIAQGALAEAVPNRDLLLSPDHALYLDGYLVPAKALVNRMSITQLNRPRVKYFHIELDEHAVIFAEGTAVETYLETGNRGCFENAGKPMVLHPDFSAVDFQAMREAQSCAPFLDDSGILVSRIRAKILDRAYATAPRQAANR
ncbi:MAG: hypothetical protein B7Z71_03015 [Acidocella sp. 21-58-7]|nr:MAG: hypothetical protein B7Z71_03015 [Acidocella sp. 21-58-7]